MIKNTEFPVIDMKATGENIRRLRETRELSVRDVQKFFGFEEPNAIYQWQRGSCLPTVDNLCALSKLMEVTMDDIIVLKKPCTPDESRARTQRPFVRMFLSLVA